MTNKRRTIIIIVSVLTGTLISTFLFMLRKGEQGLDSKDVSTLVTNLIFSLAIILGIGYFFIWKKKKEE